MKRVLLSILFAAAATLVFAADAPSLNGNWKVHVTIGNYDNEIACSFTQKGQGLTGNCSTDSGSPAPLTGTVSENKVTWTYKTDYNGPITVNYQGTLDSATKMSGTVSVPEIGADGNFTATLSQ